MRPSGREQTEGPLKGHFKHGRLYRPPLLAMQDLTLTDWVTEDLPDFLWPAVLVAIHGDETVTRFRRLHRCVVTRLGTTTIEDEQICLDGRLTSLERASARGRQAVLDLLIGSPAFTPLLPDEVLAVLRLYTSVPGAWLLLDPHTERVVDNATTMDFLARVLVDSIKDGHRNALIKFLTFEWSAVRDKIRVTPDMAAAFGKYPGDDETREYADAAIRSGWLALRGLGPGDHQAAAPSEWAALFWAQNWHLTSCIAEEEVDSRDGHSDEQNQASTPSAADSNDAVGTTPDGDHSAALADRVGDLFNSFLDVALNPTRPVDLHNPAKHEVVTGLLSRAARAVLAMTTSQVMWSGEHGATTTRLLAETEIMLVWMQQQDVNIYERYQAYGRGKAKLMHANMQNLVDEFGAEAPEYLKSSASSLESKLGDEWDRGLIEVNLDSTFSGRSVRQMAEEAGLASLYRHVYQTSSAVTHGEWWTVTDYSMQRCLNPLHRFHLIPSFAGQSPPEPIFAESMVVQLGRLLSLGLDMLFGGSADSATRRPPTG